VRPTAYYHYIFINGTIVALEGTSGQPEYNTHREDIEMEKRVLLIDDEAGLRRSVSFGLAQKGYQTEPCENGMKGLQALETHRKQSIPLDCAIVDVRLPDIDGLKLLKVIKFNYPDLPVIVITGYGNEAVEDAVRTHHADAYLEKPFMIEELVKLLEEIPGTAAIPEKTPVEDAAPAQSYVLVSLKTGTDLTKTYRKLFFLKDVLYCDAIRGEHDLMLLLQAGSPEEIDQVIDNQIRTIPGVNSVEQLKVEAPVLEENVINIMDSVERALDINKKGAVRYTIQGAQVEVSSYVMMEIEKERLPDIYPTLYFDDQVVDCDRTSGKYDIVLLMKGTSFNEIGNTIKTKFKPLDGVLRIKEWPIITMVEA
jgi:CheY-like chemotaxis protein